MFLSCGKVFSLRAEEVHELVKQALKIELQEIDDDNDDYRVRKRLCVLFSLGLIVRSERDIKNRVVFRVFLFVLTSLYMVLPLYTSGGA
jgi:hypothetical protein